MIENVVKCPLQDDFIAYELHGLVRNTTFVTDHFFRLKEKFGNLGLSLELLMYYTCSLNSNVMTSNGLEQEQRLSLQVYESHIYVYDEINLYE